ncbi:MAG TPA: hypothetical protein PLH06_11175 [Candidatus Hydrogenedentes bacterium]|nr:hypothetical protein [Candidatus Hydrogenedentota bacterium]
MAFHVGQVARSHNSIHSAATGANNAEEGATSMLSVMVAPTVAARAREGQVDQY